MKNVTIWNAIRLLILVGVLSGMTFSAGSLFGPKVQAWDSCDECRYWAEEVAHEAIMNCSVGSNTLGCEELAEQARGQYCATNCSPCALCAVASY